MENGGINLGHGPKPPLVMKWFGRAGAEKIPPSSLDLVLSWLLFYLFGSSIVVRSVKSKKDSQNVCLIRVITKLPNSEQSYKGKVKTNKYINRKNQSTTGKLWKS
jgi:hypothetical protein